MGVSERFLIKREFAHRPRRAPLYELIICRPKTSVCIVKSRRIEVRELYINIARYTYIYTICGTRRDT